MNYKWQMNSYEWRLTATGWRLFIDGEATYDTKGLTLSTVIRTTRNYRVYNHMLDTVMRYY